ncbi:magnesium protoporphyrin chelatase, putative [Thermobaculum terrenum ATCC BAA-798]|uniref:Magnesium protoporphyrin chelatase, putative n=1 Tax=Thermobaculum terrenum (strain ATCC BAA-798 / CCMEE 7001 / YNP1) TaxID=525904 RepID=D1CDB3_THET1|nr:AAA family ATPase [Thermobaculum terrenum]ACZ42778.1 magnesium protoporphyrin chelatase, putative [Thermobaculum terrenum ATCC BAA-798]
MRQARTIGELRSSGYQVRSVKDEMRQNLIRKIRRGEDLFPGIVGYEDTVIPQIENAILSGQDIILLGERGQAKTRIARSLVNLLDDYIPAIAGCEINDNPFEPICASCRMKVEDMGDDTPIEWIPRDRRYGEKLATPDITIADLIGEVDPIRVAEGRYLSDELTIHYGLVPRTNRGIFAINELPDLAERIQVGLLNIMEERDVQIRGYKIRLPLDLFVVASANPEDYTNRGRIVTPLKDRFGSEIRTHYPEELEYEIEIMEQEGNVPEIAGVNLLVPQFMKEIIAEVTHQARRSTDINQRSGVSVRVSVSNYETVVSSALKRAIKLDETTAAPRISDLDAMIASTCGKIELESAGDVSEERVVRKLIQKSILTTFNRYFQLSDFADSIVKFNSGAVIETSDLMPSEEYAKQALDWEDMRTAVQRLGVGEHPAAVASAVEFILEGLHLSRRLNKDRMDGHAFYRR